MLRYGFTTALLALFLAAPACDRAAAAGPRDDAATVATDALAATAADASAAPPARPPTSFTRTLQLRNAPFAQHPDVLVRAPLPFDRTGPVHVVVFLHGWNGCVAVIAGPDNAPCTPGGPPRYAMDVAAQFDRARVNALLVIPQLAFDAASCAPGRLGERNGLRAMLAELLAHPDLAALLGGPRNTAELGRVVVVAHSGAYVPARDVVARGGVDIHEVLLLDAVYRDLPEVIAWGRGHAAQFGQAGPAARRLAVLYTDREGTGARSRALVHALAMLVPRAAQTRVVWTDGTLRPAPPEAYQHALFAQRTAVTHEDIPRVYLAPLLETAGLPPRADAAPAPAQP